MTAQKIATQIKAHIAKAMFCTGAKISKNDVELASHKVIDIMIFNEKDETDKQLLRKIKKDI